MAKSLSVFVSTSYLSPGTFNFVDILVSELKAFNVDVWLHHERLKPGDDIKQSLIQSIDKVDKVLVVCDHEYIKAQFLNDEIEAFVKKGLDKVLVISYKDSSYVGSCIPDFYQGRVPLVMGVEDFFVNENEDGKDRYEQLLEWLDIYTRKSISIFSENYSVVMKTLALTNFRRFQQFQINFEPQLTVLVARNGAGKTSVLDAIATAEGSFLTRLPGVSGINPKESDLTVLQDGSKPSFLRIAVTNDDGVSWDRTLKRDNSESTAKQIPQGKKLNELNAYVDQLIDAHNHKAEFELPIFAYYGTGRGVFDIPQKTNGYNKTFSRFEAFSGALESRANFKRFVEYFYYLVDVDNEEKAERNDLSFQLPQLQSIRAALTRLLPEFTNLRRVRPAGIVVDWLQDNGETKTLRLEQLSDGYRTTIAMVMDIAARMAQANPDMVDSLNTRGVVLIDEVDLHLHPGWQQHILTDLMRVFPNVQFIVTTHSAQVVSSVKPECIRVIDWQGDQAIVQNIGFSEGAQAQQILQDVLGLEQLRAPQLEIVTKLKRYQQLVNEDHWDSEEATSLRQALDEWGAEYEPELQRLDMDIQLKSFKRNRQASQAQ